MRVRLMENNLYTRYMATILKGDCLEVMKGIADKSVDLIICDLPYGCLSVKRGGVRIGECPVDNPNGNIVIVNKACSWDVKLDLEKFWEQIKRIRKNDHTPIIHFCNTKFGYELIKSNEKEFRYDLVWDKQRGVSFLSANKMPMKSHEMIYVFSKAGAKYNRIDIEGDFPANCGNKGKRNSRQYNNNSELERPNNEGKRCIKSIIQNPTSCKKGGHPTEKPIDLYKWLISRYSSEGDTVLDPTFGSGNSGIACKELKRKYTGIEKDEKFFWKYVSKQ